MEETGGERGSVVSRLVGSATVLAALMAPATAQTIPDGARTITDGMRHLGDDPTPSWTEASEQPEGRRLDVEFEGRAFDGPGLLVLRQRSVDQPWHVELNGTRVATLDEETALVERFYELPAGVVRDGTNRLSIVPEVPTDDVTVGDLRYFEAPLRDVFRLRPCRVVVRDDRGALLPARVTLLDARGEPAAVFHGETRTTAVRPGVVYTSSGAAAFELSAGSYRVYASRGTEWSLAEAELRLPVEATEPVHVELELRRELDTSGFVAADTHVHTLTFSGHGDASVEERLVTLAGEGVELAVATDHNHNTDYRPLQLELELTEHFTPVVGNEVTTDIGHFNAFPLDPAGEVPLHESTDVAAIVADARAKGALAVILNHPRWPDHDSGPHGTIALDPLTGSWDGDWRCAYDALELINSETEEPRPMVLFRDWFALLNAGERVAAVASSDSHAVGEVVGQGRTYVRSATDVPAEIDADQCARDIARGHSSISMGIFVDVRRRGRSILGETLSADDAGPALGGIDVRVAAPSWVRPESLTLFANGVAIEELPLDRVERQPFDQSFALSPGLAWPAHDFWFVALARGAGVGPWWPQRNDYTLGASNPVFVDVDGDGRSACARELAQALLEDAGSEPEGILSRLDTVDTPTALQVLELARAAALRDAAARIEELAGAAAAAHPALREWAATRPDPR